MNIIIIIVIMCAILCAEFSQNRKVYTQNGIEASWNYSKFSIIPFMLSFLLLSGVCFFCKSGTDMPVYENLYLTWAIKDFGDLQFEIGDKILFVFLHTFIKNPYIGIGLVKILSIGLVFRSIFLLRKKINIGLAVLAYVVLLYIFNFHLIRMMLALGIVFVGLSNELLGNRGKCVVFLVSAVFFHYSSIIVLCTYLCYLFFANRFSVKKLLLILLGMSLIYINAVRIVSTLTGIELFSKYATYEMVTTSGVGIVQFILFVPVMLILIQRYEKEKNTTFYQLAFFCGTMTFFMGSIGYIYTVAGRLVYYFYYFFVIYGASTPLKTKEIVIKYKNFRINVSNILIYMYLALVVFVNFGLGNALESNGVLQYTTIFS